MPTPLPLRFGDIVLLPSNKQQDAETSLQFRDPQAAMEFLTSLEIDSQASADIKKILAEIDPRLNVARMMTHELNTNLARHIVSGRLIVSMRRRIRSGAGGGGSSSSSSTTTPADAAAAAAASTAAAAAPPPAAATVAAAAAAEAAQADDAAVDPAAQAEVLQQAAASGTPFCEECEKAKTAAAGGGDAGQEQAA